MRLRSTDRPLRRWPLSELLVALTGILAGACASSGPAPTPRDPASLPPLFFEERTEEAGLAGVYYPADLGSVKIIATMGAGIAWGDYDGDGDPDLFVTQGLSRDRPGEQSSECALLFRNDGTGHFDEHAERAEIRACGWGSGAVFEDVDLDGDLDLLVTLVGENQLWINRGDGTFEERGEEAGIRAAGYNVGAAFLDYDGDGRLDLYLTRYVLTTREDEWSWKGLDLRMPEDYQAPPNILLRQVDGGRFVDVTASAGVEDRQGRGLSVLAADLDLDGWSDLYVANDRGRNTFFRNQGDGRFEDDTILSGAGVGKDGTWESAMGLALGDVDGNAYPDILVTNYVDEPNTLFLNQEGWVFEDRTRQYGLFEAAYDWVAWGAEFRDLDNDGRLDLFVANGHILPTWIARLGLWMGGGDEAREKLIRAYSKGGYEQPLLLYHGEEGSFRHIPDFTSRPPFRRLAGRGASAADIDGDGLLDLFVHSIPEKSPATLLVNRSPRPGGWLSLDLRSGNRGRQLLGSRVTVTGGGRIQHLQLYSGGSYLSGSALPLHVGLGEAKEARIELRLPDGSRRRFEDVGADRRVELGPSFASPTAPP